MGRKPKLTRQRQESLARRDAGEAARGHWIIQMIRVDIVEEAKSPGVFRYRVPGMAIEGRSRQPLIDACRQIKALVGGGS